MRFESKNAQIKSFLSHSFKNTPLTAAIHHQQWMCYTVLTDPRQTKSNFFYAGDEVNSGIYTVATGSYSYNKNYNIYRDFSRGQRGHFVPPENGFAPPEFSYL